MPIFVLPEDPVLPDSLLVLGHASIPLVQYRDNQTGLKIDVSFNLTEAVASSQLVNMWKLQVGAEICSQPASAPPVARPAPPGAGAEAAFGLEGPGHGLHGRSVLALPHHDGRLLPPAAPQDPGHLPELGGPAPRVPQPIWQVINSLPACIKINIRGQSSFYHSVGDPHRPACYLYYFVLTSLLIMHHLC